MLIAFNLISFQIGWFASVLGAANDMSWLGPMVVVLFFAAHLKINGHMVREISLGLKIIIIGFVTDTLLTIYGVYTPKPFFFPAPYSPPWLIFLWLNFATLLNVSLKWLSHRYLLAVFLGGTGGALAYYGGSVFGVMTFNPPLVVNLLITGLVWAALTPLFFILSRFIDQKLAQQTT
ncbi:MAG: DUF2878 domain-containing protein [Desulfurivibrionaceae bacterium]|nr:DUF2878 domain-containing protein [Desulfurivibrionaceae bacterium]